MWLLTWIIASVSNCLILSPLTSFSHGLLYNMQIWLFDFPIITIFECPPPTVLTMACLVLIHWPLPLSYADSCRIHTHSRFHVLALRFLFLGNPSLSHAFGTAIAIVRNCPIASSWCSFFRISSQESLPSISKVWLDLSQNWVTSWLLQKMQERVVTWGRTRGGNRQAWA